MEVAPVILFLDIDGVLTNGRIHVAYSDVGIWWRFDPVVVQFLQRMLAKYNLKIVISSTWRRNYHVGRDDPYKDKTDTLEKSSMEHLLQRFEYEGFARDNFHTDAHTPLHYNHKLRGAEIEEWLSAHPEITQYIILDDDSDFYENQKHYFVHTDGLDGMRIHEFVKFERILETFRSQSS